MSNELIINVTLGETRVARLENGIVSELHIERAMEEEVVNNIYKGKVTRVMPGMQAAFVDIGLERTAFLHVEDVVEKLSGLDLGESKPARGRSRGPRAIERMLKGGAEILVQVEKAPMGTKGARITSHISLPGRYLVYLPTAHNIGISRRIEDPKERSRLRKTVSSLKAPGGFIIRTVSEGAAKPDLQTDAEYLINLWGEIEKSAAKTKAPSLIRAELDVMSRIGRDFITNDINKIVIDDEAAAKNLSQFMDRYMRGSRGIIETYTGSEPIFDAYGIEVEITRALGQKVWLKSGGYIIIEQTEALTAIDVNTGKFVGRRSVEDTILKTNLEAVKEIVYQLKLRSIGGIIILDFIDMEKASSRNKVYNALKEALKSDKARSTITKISEIGLVEMTRKRTREDIRHQLTNTCPYCEGKGYLKSTKTICFEIFRELNREAPHMQGNQVVVHCHHSVANTIFDDERAWLEEFEKKFKKRIIIKEVPDYHLEQFDISEK